MQLETTRFGTLDIDPETIITFTQPILGFQEYRRFVLLPGPSDSLSWLQATDTGELAFILLNPYTVQPEYRVELRRGDLTELGAANMEELEVYTLVVVPPDRQKIRTNLKAPIIINPNQRLAKQVILEKGDYPVQFFLAQPQSDASSGEVSNARSHP